MQIDSIRVDGGVSLQGKVRIQGSKNACLPVMAATLLTNGESRICNCPKISDVFRMKQLLGSMGCIIREDNNGITIDTRNVQLKKMPSEAVQGMRSSICMLGALLGRVGEVCMEYPGGCVIGARPIDMHLMALEKMGAVFRMEENMIYGHTENGFHGADILFSKESVGATENVILAAVCAKGHTRITGAAKEPEVETLCRYLVKCGAQISGIGSGNLEIDGVEALNGCKMRIPADRIVAGTYLFAVLAAGGSAWLEEAPCEQMEAVIQVARKMGAVCQTGEDGLYVQAPERLLPVKSLKTGVYPDFPTDLQSVALVANLRAEGVSIIEETIFENRFHIVEPLQDMGADVEILDESRVRVTGPCVLSGKPVEAWELRGGAAMVLAGLMAEGVSTIKGCQYIMRGYENIAKDLTELGARVFSVRKA